MGNSNLPIISVEDLVTIVETQLKEQSYRPIFALGKGGIGKTESMEHLAKEVLHIGYVDIRLLLYSETDLKGIPYPDENHVKTVWLQNNILPTVEKDGKVGILVLDEITSCAKSVRTAAYQLLNERRLGEYVLPDNWLIVCLGNGEEDGGDFNGMEGNFANRCSVFNVVPDVETWKKWAFLNNVNSLVTGYVSFKPGDLHSYNPNDETEILFASPRSWTEVSRLLNLYKYSPDDRILQARITANLGQRVAQQFKAFCKYKDKTIDINDIMAGKKIPESLEPEIIYITIQSLTKTLATGLIEEVKNTGQITIQSLTKLSNSFKWLFSLKVEYAIMGLKDLINHDKHMFASLMVNKDLMDMCPELHQFANDNYDIFE